MITGNEGYIIDVIADLQKRLASETASNKYLRGELEMTHEHVAKLNDILKQCDFNAENLNAKIAQLQAEINAFDDAFSYQNHIIAEQKETIETLQSSVKSMDLEYKTLAAEYNALS